MTLAEGLAEYYAGRLGLVDGRGASEEAAHFFRCHDAAHVVFGCSTTLTNEAMVKIWSLFGTTAGFTLLRDYASPESQEIYEKIPWSAVPGVALRSLVNLPRVLVGCARLAKRWPWSDYERYRDARLDEIRREFHINLVQAP